RFSSPRRGASRARQPAAPERALFSGAAALTRLQAPRRRDSDRTRHSRRDREGHSRERAVARRGRVRNGIWVSSCAARTCASPLPAFRRAHQGRSRLRTSRFQEGGFKTGSHLMTPLLLLALLQTAEPPIRPSAALGFEPGTDSMLADWKQVSGYLNSLAQQSRYVRVDTLGRTTEGRPFLLMTIPSPANQGRLAEIKRTQAMLADPRRLTDTAF